MIEQIGNLWDFHNLGNWIVISVNGTIKSNGEAVMGRGCALECKQRYPEFPKLLANFISEYGNTVGIHQDYKIITLPTKNHWKDKSDLKLIELSLHRLRSCLLGDIVIPPIYLPRLGCGFGGLNWIIQVKPLCEKYLDDRFIILTKESWIPYEDSFDVQIIGK